MSVEDRYVERIVELGVARARIAALEDALEDALCVAQSIHGEHTGTGYSYPGCELCSAIAYANTASDVESVKENETNG